MASSRIESVRSSWRNSALESVNLPGPYDPSKLPDMPVVVQRLTQSVVLAWKLPV